MDRELKSRLKSIYDASKSRCIATCVHYGGSKDTLDIRHLEKLDRILDAEDLNLAAVLAKRAEDSVFMSCLSLWAKNKLRGPNSVELWDGKAAKAESLARYFERQSQDKYVVCEPGAPEKMLAKAQKQRHRAEKLREYAAQLRNNPNTPQPDFSADEDIEVPAEEPAPKKRGRAKAVPPTPTPPPAPTVVEAKTKRKVVGIAPKLRRKRTA